LELKISQLYRKLKGPNGAPEPTKSSTAAQPTTEVKSGPVDAAQRKRKRFPKDGSTENVATVDEAHTSAAPAPSVSTTAQSQVNTGGIPLQQPYFPPFHGPFSAPYAGAYGPHPSQYPHHPYYPPVYGQQASYMPYQYPISGAEPSQPYYMQPSQQFLPQQPQQVHQPQGHPIWHHSVQRPSVNVVVVDEPSKARAEEETVDPSSEDAQRSTKITVSFSPRGKV
jgi:hypothetical protein